MKKLKITNKPRRSFSEMINKIEDKDEKIEILEYFIDRLRYQLVKEHKAESELFLIKLNQLKEETASKKNELSKQTTELRRKLKAGEIDTKQYQKEIAPLSKEKRMLTEALNDYEYYTLERLFPESHITPEEVKKYLDEECSCGGYRTRTGHL